MIGGSIRGDCTVLGVVESAFLGVVCVRNQKRGWVMEMAWRSCEKLGDRGFNSCTEAGFT